MSNPNPKNEDNDGGVLAGIVVVIEWGGKKPSSTWYNRLHEYGLYSRQPSASKSELDLFEWRGSQRGGLKSATRNGMILQEGVLMVSSLSLAEDISAWAQAEGALFVQVGHMVTKKFTMSEKAVKHFEGLQKNMSTRGPKRKTETGSYVVTCFAEALTYTVELEGTPFQCVHCGASNIVARLGTRHTYSDIIDEGTPRDYWARTRFATGHFEIPTLKTNEKKSLAVSPKFSYPAVQFPQFEDGLEEKFIAKGSWQEYWHMLDVAFCVSQMTKRQRLDGRLMVINAFIMAGGTTAMSFNPSAAGLDIVDLCIIDKNFAEEI